MVRKGHPSYPYLTVRSFLCGHPDEAIWVDQETIRVEGGLQKQIIHNIIVDYSGPLDETTQRPKRLNDETRFTIEKCRTCARDKCLDDRNGAKAKDIARMQGMPQRTPEEREKQGHFVASLERHKALVEAEMEPRIREVRTEISTGYDQFWTKKGFLKPWPLPREANPSGKIKPANGFDVESIAKENAAMAVLPTVVMHEKVQEKAVVNGAKVRHPNGVDSYKRAERRYQTQDWLAQQRFRLELTRRREDEEERQRLAQEAEASGEMIF